MQVATHFAGSFFPAVSARRKTSMSSLASPDIESKRHASLKLRVADPVIARPSPGLLVDRPFPTPALSSIGPFIMLDHYGPTTIGAGERGGVGPHPHAGIETVSMLLHGDQRHADSLGNVSVMGVGDVQWMHAGSGVVHEETPGPQLLEEGGLLEGLQLWINQPADCKGREPSFFHVGADSVPSVPIDGGIVQVIAGLWRGRVGPGVSTAELLLLECALQTGATLAMPPVPAGWEMGVYVIEGLVEIDAADVGKRQVATWRSASLGMEGDDETSCRAHAPVPIRACTHAHFLILGGPIIDEPMVAHGPFVASSQELLGQYQDDYRRGAMGILNGVPF